MHIIFYLYSKRAQVPSGDSSSTAASNELPGYDCDGGSNDSSSSDEDSKRLTDTRAKQMQGEGEVSAIDDDSDFPLDDIGALLRTMSLSSIRSLPPEMKYLILTKHFRPGSNFKFPSRYLDVANRSCQYKYLQENPWFVYSRVEDVLFCLPCVLFARKHDLGQFVHKKWSKKLTNLHLTMELIITNLLSPRPTA